MHPWVRGTWKKLEFASGLVEAGYDVAWSDTDVLIVKDPLQFTQVRPADIYVAPGEPNTGFMYFRSNNDTTTFVATWLGLRQVSRTNFQIDDQSAFIMLHSLFKRPVLSARVAVLPEAHFKLGCGGCGLDLLAESDGTVWFDKRTMCPFSVWSEWAYVHVTCAGLATNHGHIQTRKTLAQEGLMQVYSEHGICAAEPP